MLPHQKDVKWCMRLLRQTMMAKSSRQGGSHTTEQTARASITLPVELHQTLQQIAKHKKVSLAWVMRDAAEKYVADQWPLLGGRK